MSNTGRRLRENNEEILKYINQLREQRNELGFLVEKQKTEKANLEAEMARITYKLSLINKSLGQRARALHLYDTTIMEIEAKYKGLADSTQGLLSQVRTESSNLENSIDKRIGTESECKNCPRCDLDPQNQLRTQVSGALSEIPTKQPNEGEKRNTKIEYKGHSHTEEQARNLSNNPIYSRAMEYPMMLSPMINKEHLEQIKEKIASNSASSQGLKNLSASDNKRPSEGSSVYRQIISHAANESQKDGELSQSTVATGNFIDGDYSDIQPSRDISGDESPMYKEMKPKEITPLESPVPSSVDMQVTDAEKSMIEDYDDVIEEVESGSDSIGSGMLTPASSFLKRTMVNNSIKEAGRRQSILKTNKRRSYLNFRKDSYPEGDN
ncbi:uncharacterized protein LOC123319918 isoform X2 [Coccinella septempunctata]|uniref:uncharacterized protein LOC123319918 isoform X2 n=1 Tax=Coccinella septempunctata TaxID=41139 RepID=UPI001D08BB32|nr:uncharacterized protein LOC123319918 isoform X2 [Coccinella septempunctata]